MNTAFNTIKIIHVLGACCLFGVNITMTLYALLSTSQKNVAFTAMITKQLVIISICVIGTALFLQPITGFTLAYLKGYTLSSLWGVGSLIGYGVIAFLWLPILFLQIHCKELACQAAEGNQSLPKIYYQYLTSWMTLSVITFFCMSAVFYLMTTRPGT